METITIEQVEALAERLEADDEAQRAKLSRLIRAYARILIIREPEQFRARAREIRDEAGHSDNSYPPEGVEYNHSGPELIEIRPYEVDDVPTSGGYYHTWRRETNDPGLYVDGYGRIYGAECTGTGRVGQFAAYPGNCDREIEIEWEQRRHVSTVDLVEVERDLRAIAFPASADLDLDLGGAAS